MARPIESTPVLYGADADALAASLEHGASAAEMDRRSRVAVEYLSKMERQAVELSRAQLEAEAIALANEVWQTSADEAWRRLRAGELDGTWFAVRMAQLRWLLGGNE